MLMDRLYVGTKFLFVDCIQVLCYLANCIQVLSVGEHLLSTNHRASPEIKSKIKSLTDKWNRLKDLAQKRKTRLEDAAESHQVCICNNRNLVFVIA